MSFKSWLLETGNNQAPEAAHAGHIEGAHVKRSAVHHTHSWWQVMCLTGVDYFSTLGYQPGIAALAAGALSPIATLVLVLLTLFGALPMYKRVAFESPHGDGSISMLEGVLKWWQGKLFVLALIGFAATGFIITITLSAADATAHIMENPFAPVWLHGQHIPVTLFLIALLGAVFLKGFGEAIGIAVALVAVYIGLNLVVLGVGFKEILSHPTVIGDWKSSLFSTYVNPLAMIGAALLVFPKLALGLSGFETGVVVMPLVKGEPNDDEQKPMGRIKNARKLLTTAALIMSVLLLCSSFVTTLLIPAKEFAPPTANGPAGEAYGRALAYVAHRYLGDAFGTVYDVSTIFILWFAGSSAMAGLLNIVPRYLPRYGMAPEWTRATRPLVLIFTTICFLVTLAFKAGVEAQAGAYATGVLALMTSATIAVTLSAKRAKETKAMWGFGLVAAIFIYTTGITVIQRPEGLKISLIFIVSIIIISLLSRLYRSTELRVEHFEIDETAQRIINEAAQGQLRFIANEPNERDSLEYELKEQEQREDNHIPPGDPVIFIEVTVVDASNFAHVIEVCGEERHGYKVLRVFATSVPNALAAFLVHVRDTTGKIPHIYFAWTEGNPFMYLLKYIVFGEGDIAPVTREILRSNEKDRERRPSVHVGG